MGFLLHASTISFQQQVPSLHIYIYTHIHIFIYMHVCMFFIMHYYYSVPVSSRKEQIKSAKFATENLKQPGIHHSWKQPRLVRASFWYRYFYKQSRGSLDKIIWVGGWLANIDFVIKMSTSLVQRKSRKKRGEDVCLKFTML